MSLVVPRVGLTRMLDEIVADTLTLRLFSNNIVPSADDTSLDYTEVLGGGYAAVPLVGANWTVVSGNPSTATYNSFLQFNFSGATNSPGSVFGYYITRASGEVVAAEALYTHNPFIPIASTYVKVKPQITYNSIF